MTASMIYPTPYLDRIHPHKILHVVAPHGVEFLLTDGTREVGEGLVGRDGDVFVFGVGGGEGGGEGGFGGGG